MQDRRILTLADARDAGIAKHHIYAQVASGQLERIGRGVFASPGADDPSTARLAAATAVQPRATLCLTSAFAAHGLSDEIPFGSDIALPRGTRHPAGFKHVNWHSFAVATFDIGRVPFGTVGDIALFAYSPERAIIDAFRLAHQEGTEVAVEALKRWLRQGGQPSELLSMARSFPRVVNRIRELLEVLL